MLLGAGSFILAVPSWKPQVGLESLETLSLTNLRCQHSPGVLYVNYTMMQNKMWQSKRCFLNILIIHLLLERSHKWKSYTLSPIHPLKIHQVRRGSLHQLKRLHMKIHRKDRFQYIIFKKWYSQRFAPLLFYKIFDLLLICIFTLSNATRSQYISRF